MSLNLPAGVQINAPIKPEYESILTTEALEFVAKLHRACEGRRQELLKARVERQARIDCRRNARLPAGNQAHPRRRLEGRPRCLPPCTAAASKSPARWKPR